ncbi:MAG: hypothetical protein WCO84_03775 [bacterium]
MYRIKDYLNTISKKEPSNKLFSLILKRIDTEKAKIAKRNLFYSTIGAIVSSFTLYFGINYANQGFIDSGFYNYFSLVFSDGGTILVFWKEFIISIAESLPVIEITIVLSALLALLISIGTIIKNIAQTPLLKLSNKSIIWN